MELKRKPDATARVHESVPEWAGDSAAIQALRAAISQMAAARAGRMSLREMRQLAEREAITRALREHQGQVPAAAVSLGISRAQLYRLIGRFGLDLRPDYDDTGQAPVAARA